jgi:hypothetical protein
VDGGSREETRHGQQPLVLKITNPPFLPLFRKIMLKQKDRAE